MGHVSPQYHCQFDDHFEIVQGNNAKFVPKLQWQIKTHIHKTRESARQEQQHQNILEEDIVPVPAEVPPEPEVEQEQPQPQQQPEEAVMQPEEDLQHKPANQLGQREELQHEPQ